MCPLRFILIFLSATLAGFFVLRNLKSQPQDFEADDNSETHSNDVSTNSTSSSSSSSSFSKVSSAMQSGFWTVVDMASGRYLWRHLMPSSKKPSN
ncbi:uncharacterized protein LOC111782825 [Cucurbita pepo subsp. pepo]|uniref:uncharacterized protein LOC111782825 n=1 Tax=Cucurbita pepo subsp. pepo TaxID=3664 RepID=UPI000C9D714C|nr:uncharacterized protein LOC111782825 [Cucurbita pepo subsp. pepo]